jgi:hypothetical protein
MKTALSTPKMMNVRHTLFARQTQLASAYEGQQTKLVFPVRHILLLL